MNEQNRTRIPVACLFLIFNNVTHERQQKGDKTAFRFQEEQKRVREVPYTPQKSKVGLTLF